MNSKSLIAKSVISYQLPVTSYQLPVISYQLSVTSYPLSVIRYLLNHLVILSEANKEVMKLATVNLL
ncbi:hypothetical protein BGP_5421 [Beggiatoa sp. PS]|nr:hypothetical protein BGP_5421 [Beggiatoa sp. PS]